MPALVGAVVIAASDESDVFAARRNERGPEVHQRLHEPAGHREGRRRAEQPEDERHKGQRDCPGSVEAHLRWRRGQWAAAAFRASPACRSQTWVRSLRRAIASTRGGAAATDAGAEAAAVE